MPWLLFQMSQSVRTASSESDATGLAPHNRTASRAALSRKLDGWTARKRGLFSHRYKLFSHLQSTQWNNYWDWNCCFHCTLKLVYLVSLLMGNYGMIPTIFIPTFQTISYDWTLTINEDYINLNHPDTNSKVINVKLSWTLRLSVI